MTNVFPIQKVANVLELELNAVRAQAKRNMPGGAVDWPTDGVQPWSVGSHYPYVVFLRETYSENGGLISARWIVSFNGDFLADFADIHEAHRMADVFKAHDVRTVDEALCIVQWEKHYQQVATEKAVALAQGKARERSDNLMLYGTEEHKALTLAELQADKCAGKRIPTTYSDRAYPRDDTQ